MAWKIHVKRKPPEPTTVELLQEQVRFLREFNAALRKRIADERARSAYAEEELLPLLRTLVDLSDRRRDRAAAQSSSFSAWLNEGSVEGLTQS